MKNDYELTNIAAMAAEENLDRKAALLQRLAQECRLDVLDILHEKQTGHWGGAASCAELLAALYFGRMSVRPDEPRWEDRDRLVLGKGHASAMLYTVLAKRGFFQMEEVVRDFRQINTRMQGHPCMNKTPGVDMSTGALGHGISVGTGMALAARVAQKKYWTYVIVGDGCLNEGESWEGIMTAAKYRPERLVLMVDYNRVQLDGPACEVMPLDPLAEKLRAFGWHLPRQVYDGHNIRDILDSFEWIDAKNHWPMAVVYQTVKGRGVSFMENNHKWHGAPVDEESHRRGRSELLEGLRCLEVSQ